ncbi:MAG TPA: hypothetical protein VNO32_41900, partial [Candidatus Acidoferrum sp.]|nr:hypothetical protein [Candidatus Acidoferrum sp.]
ERRLLGTLSRMRKPRDAFVHKSYLNCSKTARIAPNNDNHAERKLLIPNNRDAATLICKQGVTGSIPVTSTNFLGKTAIC